MAPQPTLLVRGSLGQTSLPELLVYALDKELEGSLLLQTAAGEKNAIFFSRGAPAKARLAQGGQFFEAVLVELGLVSAEDCARAQARAAELGRFLGDLLVEQNLLDTTGLYVALREQLRRQVLELCRLPLDTNFGFYDVNFLAKWGPDGQWRVKPLPLIWRALVEHLPEERVALVVSKLGDRVLKLRPESPVSRYQMAPNEAAVVSVLRVKPQGLSTLGQSGVGSLELVRRVVSALVLSRQLYGVVAEKDPVGLQEPPESPASIAPPVGARPPRSLTPPRVPFARSVTPPGVRAQPTTPPTLDVAEFRAEVEEKEAHPPVTFYDLLGVPREADAASVRAAFFQLARKWHPDKLPSEAEELRPQVTRLFARMGEAHQVLTDATRRAEYDRLLANAPDDEQAQVAGILEAASAFQRAEIFLKKRDHESALREARAAYQGDSSQADYVALYAWLESLQRTSDFEELLALLDRALEIQPMNVRALWYRGQLLKKVGKTAQAMRDFRDLVELRPNHVDAQREIRVYEMRRRTDRAAPDKADKKSERTRTDPRGGGSSLRPSPGKKSETPPGGKTGLFGRFLKKD